MNPIIQVIVFLVYIRNWCDALLRNGNGFLDITFRAIVALVIQAKVNGSHVHSGKCL